MPVPNVYKCPNNRKQTCFMYVCNAMLQHVYVLSCSNKFYGKTKFFSVVFRRRWGRKIRQRVLNLPSVVGKRARSAFRALANAPTQMSRAAETWYAMSLRVFSVKGKMASRTIKYCSVTAERDPARGIGNGTYVASRTIIGGRKEEEVSKTRQALAMLVQPTAQSGK